MTTPPGRATHAADLLHYVVEWALDDVNRYAVLSGRAVDERLRPAQVKDRAQLANPTPTIVTVVLAVPAASTDFVLATLRKYASPEASAAPYLSKLVEAAANLHGEPGTTFALEQRVKYLELALRELAPAVAEEFIDAAPLAAFNDLSRVNDALHARSADTTARLLVAARDVVFEP